MTFLRISGRDPLVARDSRPFGAGQGNRMRSSGWPYPSVVAGSFRTLLAKAAGRDFDEATQDELLKISVAGVLPLIGDEPYLPAPSDCVMKGKEVVRARPRPVEPGEGADWPAQGLQPVLIDTDEDFKPERGPAFWPLSRYRDWLIGKEIDPRDGGFLAGPIEDLRDHVSLDPDTGAASEGLLFTTVGISSMALPKYGRNAGAAKPTGTGRAEAFAEIDLTARAENVPLWGQETLSALSVWHPLGGERRLAHWQTAADEKGWECPPPVEAALRNSRRVTMTLATPAIFSGGWRPDWLHGQLTGSPPDNEARLTLVGVSVGRWRAVSGWSYKTGGPKEIRRMVPAGGVYFFESDRSDNSALADHWLRPVSDNEQARRDGFGLALWGTW